MSLGYASRLSDREDLGGRLGDPEIFDRPADVVAKAGQLADMVGSTPNPLGHVVAFTAADAGAWYFAGNLTPSPLSVGN
jgi:hypothetical protein